MTPRRTALALLPLAACFGGGAAPKPPPGATLVFQVPVPAKSAACQDSVYVGPVGIADDKGYVIPIPYTPPDNCNQGMGGGISLPMSILTFAKNGATPAGEPVGGGDVGSSNMGVNPAIATRGSDVIYAYSQSGQPMLGPAMAPVQAPNTGPSVNPSWLWIDTGTLYAVFSGDQGAGADPASPQFPGGPQNTTLMSNVTTIPLPLVMNQSITPTVVANELLRCEESQRCVVSTSTGVFWVAQPTTGTGSFEQLHVVPRSGGSEMAYDFPAPGPTQSLTMVGLDADDTRVVAAFSPSAFGTSTLEPGCSIFVSQGQAPMLAFHSDRFACMDAALDGDNVYFTIVHGEPCDCGQPFLIHGDGIARISLTDPTLFESIAVHMTGQNVGPRRVFVDQDAIFAVDPFSIARIDKTQLDGKHDFGQ